jgi:hypothetical protein
MSTETYSGCRAMQIQLARLFGSQSKEARTKTRTAAQWRKSLKAVLQEIDRYVAANVDTDELHQVMVLSGLAGAAESLKQEDFWPGYAEGMTRLALTLLGDYPDHRRRKPGRKRDGHYLLNRSRSVQWTQTPRQRFLTVMDAGCFGHPRLSARPSDILFEFRKRFGTKPSQSDFLEWYRNSFPNDYAAIFR